MKKKKKKYNIIFVVESKLYVIYYFKIIHIKMITQLFQYIN